jgi:hypothetical protein
VIYHGATDLFISTGIYLALPPLSYFADVPCVPGIPCSRYSLRSRSSDIPGIPGSLRPPALYFRIQLSCIPTSLQYGLTSDGHVLPKAKTRINIH